MDYSKYDVDLAEFQGAFLPEEDSKDYPEIPDGEYECRVEKLEYATSKAGNNMVKGTFRILAGEYKNQCMFMNSVLKTRTGYEIFNGMVRDFDVWPDKDEFRAKATFENWDKFADYVAETFERITTQGLEYAIAKKTNDKGFTNYRVTQVYEPEPEGEEE